MSDIPNWKPTSEITKLTRKTLADGALIESTTMSGIKQDLDALHDYLTTGSDIGEIEESAKSGCAASAYIQENSSAFNDLVNNFTAWNNTFTAVTSNSSEWNYTVTSGNTYINVTKDDTISSYKISGYDWNPEIESASSALQEQINNISNEVNRIDSYIPDDTTTANPLTNESYVNYHITQNVARFLTNSAGNSFSSFAEFSAASANDLYYGRVKISAATKNDYVVITDNETKEHETSRYVYVGEDDSGSWVYQYQVNPTPFEPEQWDAINSKITSAKVDNYDSTSAIVKSHSAQWSIDTTYTAGDNIDITNNVISGKYWTDEIDNAGTSSLNSAKSYTNTKLNDYYKKTETSSKSELSAKFNTKQDNLVASSYIKIENNNIAATGLQPTASMTAYYKKTETSGADEIANALTAKQNITAFTAWSSTTFTGNSAKSALSAKSAFSAATATKDSYGNTINANAYMSASKLGFDNNKITGYNGIAIGGGIVTSALAPLKIDDNGTISNNGDSVVVIGSHAWAEGNGTSARGNYSHAEGGRTIAHDVYSHAEGFETETNGGASHAEGYHTNSIGLYSHAEGNETIASGDWSHAEGTGSLANGQSTHSEGYHTSAIGNYSHSEGTSNLSNNIASHTEGSANSVSGDCAHAEGCKNTILFGGYTHVEGYNNVISGNQSHAEGGNTSALAHWAHTEGYATEVNSIQGGHAEGDSTKSLGLYAHAEGHKTSSYGAYSHTEGEFTKAIGNQSHAEGSWTSADGSDSHAEGSRTSAWGGNSHSEGEYTLASGYASHSEGGETSAMGNYSHAGGLRTSAYGVASFAHGYSDSENSYIAAYGHGSVAMGASYNPDESNAVEKVLASGTATIALGVSVTALSPNYGGAVAVGRENLASGDGSFVAGFGNEVSGQAAFAIGKDNSVSGIASFALGSANSASNLRRSIAIGGVCVSNGVDSIALGYKSSALADDSYTLGNTCIASNDYAIAANHFTSATGKASFACGSGTIARYDNEFVCGKYNVNSPGSSGIDPIFAVGNGTSNSNRKDIITIYNNNVTNVNGTFKYNKMDIDDKYIHANSITAIVTATSPGTDTQTLYII